MDLTYFTLGKRLDAQEIFARQGDSASYNKIQTPIGQPKTKIAEVYFMELGVIFRPMASFGPSTLDVVIPYGSPVYRASAHPLSALKLQPVFNHVLEYEDSGAVDFLQQVGLLPVLSELSKCSGFYGAGMLVGQKKAYSKGRNPGRSMFIVNDCINEDASLYRDRTALVDVNFRYYRQGVMLQDELCINVLDLLKSGASERVKLTSVEWRKDTFHGETKATAHVYLEVTLDGENSSSEWWNFCHALYRQSFFDTTQDLADRKYAEKLALLGGPTMLGEYDWLENVCNIEPPVSDAYILSCTEFRALKEKLKDLYNAGQNAEFAKRVHCEAQKVGRTSARDDYLEGLAMRGELYFS